MIDIRSVAELTLASPSTTLFGSYADFIQEMRVAGEAIWPTRIPAVDEDEEAFITRLLSLENEPPPPMVRQTGTPGGALRISSGGRVTKPSTNRISFKLLPGASERELHASRTSTRGRGEEPR